MPWFGLLGTNARNCCLKWLMLCFRDTFAAAEIENDAAEWEIIVNAKWLHEGLLSLTCHQQNQPRPLCNGNPLCLAYNVIALCRSCSDEEYVVFISLRHAWNVVVSRLISLVWDIFYCCFPKCVVRSVGTVLLLPEQFRSTLELCLRSQVVSAHFRQPWAMCSVSLTHWRGGKISCSSATQMVTFEDMKKQ